MMVTHKISTMTSETWWQRSGEARIRTLPKFDRTSLVQALIGVLVGWLAGALLVDFGLPEMAVWKPHLLLMVSGVIGGLFRRPGLQWVPVAADGLLIVAYIIIAGTPLMSHLAGRWVRSDSLPASAEAIIVLSASVNSGGMLNVSGVQRLLTGI